MLASRQILLEVNIHASEVGYGEREGCCPRKGLLMEPSKLSLLFQITASQETSGQLKIAGSSGFTLFMSPRINFAHNTKFFTRGLSCLPKCVCCVCALTCVCEREGGDIELLLSYLFIFVGVGVIIAVPQQVTDAQRTACSDQCSPFTLRVLGL